MTREVCPTCLRPLPFKRSEPTTRELDVLAAWWRTQNVKLAADEVGLTYQRVKNILARCRIRSGVKTNDELLIIHLDALRSRMGVGLPQTASHSEAA